MEYIGGLFLSGFILLFLYGVSFGLVTLFKKWNLGEDYKGESGSDFIISHLITAVVSLYFFRALFWSTVTLLVLTTLLMLYFMVFLNNKRK